MNPPPPPVYLSSIHKTETEFGSPEIDISDGLATFYIRLIIQETIVCLVLSRVMTYYIRGRFNSIDKQWTSDLELWE